LDRALGADSTDAIAAAGIRDYYIALLIDCYSKRVRKAGASGRTIFSSRIARAGHRRNDAHRIPAGWNFTGLSRARGKSNATERA
jgi:hypothetical protein